uniref:Histidine triad family protein n=1 Tax=Solanum tuberosum TaxID=4113 RepID=M1BUL0_SOLTU
MEATSTATALRRLSILSSHFRTHCSYLQVSAFNCSSTDGENQENGCVFCLIVRGEAPALKTHIHIIPRKASDCLWTSESLSRCPLKSDEAQKLADGIKENLSISNNIEDSKGHGSSLIVN